MNPYEFLPERQYWRTGVVEQDIFSINDLYKKKFTISDGKIATAGSCFAQHISRRLAKAGFDFYDAEPAPLHLPAQFHTLFGYGTYSARFGNIYTTRQLLQLLLEATGQYELFPYAWEKNGKFYDPLRPSVEPYGLPNSSIVLAHREYHLERIKELFESLTTFIFTLGLTETWECTETGRVLPVAPGVIAGNYDPQKYIFKNLSYQDIKDDLLQFFRNLNLLRNNKPYNVILTVSPVPLTATATDNHVLSATTFSKSILRAVAGDLSQNIENVDYFPSYEIISSNMSRGVFYHSNMRTVCSAGVDSVMRVFFDQHRSTNTHERLSSVNLKSELSDEEVLCDEALLEAFS